MARTSRSNTTDTLSRTDSPTPNSMSGYEALETNDVRQVYDTIDDLRRIGLSTYVFLPQIIVVGDQSSGKSSVLENITGIPFPRNEGLCTRFATQITMRRAARTKFAVKIDPDGECSESERRKLKAFKAQFKDFKNLPKVIDDATKEMGLGRVGKAGVNQLSKHVLHIAIDKPDLTNLTLVDLPGLIHVAGSGPDVDGKDDDKTIIDKLVKRYIDDPRSIILAVVSGKNDYNNQVVLNHWKDPTKSHRMLGIITKPDTIAKSDVHNWIDLAMNKKEIVLKHGWHMVRNRAADEMDFTVEECHDVEEEFFEEDEFADLPRDSVGIQALRGRLSKLLFDHIRAELPNVARDIQDALKVTVHELERMGSKRTNSDVQREMLLNISGRVQELIKGAVFGYYADSFFRNLDMEAAPDSDENSARLRAAVHHLNLQFANTMRRQGHKYSLGSGLGDDDADVAKELQAEYDVEYMVDEDIGARLPRPKIKDRDDSIEWVRKVLVRTRGTELPGSSNAMTVAHLFWEQSEPWKDIATEHINNVHRMCKDFTQKIIEHSAPPDILERLLDKICDVLEDALGECEKELGKIIDDVQHSSPITFDKNFTTELQKQRQRKHTRIAQLATEHAKVPYAQSVSNRLEINPILLEQALSNSIEYNMDRFTAEEVLDTLRVYYKQHLNQVIDNVCRQVIERHLVRELPKLILSPQTIHKMTDEEVRFVASESSESTERRKSLEQRRAMLRKGLDKFQAHRRMRR